MFLSLYFFFFFSSRIRHTRCLSDWSSDVCSSDLHGSELVTGEFAPPVADAPLAEQYRTSRAANHHQSSGDAEQQQPRQKDYHERQIERPLPQRKSRGLLACHAAKANVTSIHNLFLNYYLLNPARLPLPAQSPAICLQATLGSRPAWQRCCLGCRGQECSSRYSWTSHEHLKLGASSLHLPVQRL